MQTNLPKNPPRAHRYPVIPAGAKRSRGIFVSRLRSCLFFAVGCLLLPSPVTRAQTAQTAVHQIHVAAAVDLQPVLPALAEAFTQATGIKLIVRYETSATLARQLLAGDPADLFLATDYSFPEKLVAAKLTDTPEPIDYARGILVLWARKDSPFQPLTQTTLSDPRIQSLAIANPDRAPYGRAAVATLLWMKLYDKLKPHIVVAEDLTQAAQFVESGKAQLGFLSLTAASTQHSQQIGSFIRMPPSVYPEIRECAVVLLKSTHSADAHTFLDWLRSPPIQMTLPTYGLAPIQ